MLKKILNVCSHHKETFLSPRYEKKFKSCCDTNKSHRKKVNGTITITLETAKALKKLWIDVKPGWRICVTCYKRFKIDYQCLNSPEDSSAASFSNSTDLSSDGEPKLNFHTDSAKETLNKTFNLVGVSPVESAHSLPKRQRILKARNKVAQVKRQLEKSFAAVIGTEEK